MRRGKECAVCLGKWDPKDDADYKLDIIGFKKTNICWDCHCNSFPNKNLEFVPQDRCFATLHKKTGKKEVYWKISEFLNEDLSDEERKDLTFCLPITKRWNKETLDAFMGEKPRINKDNTNVLCTWEYPKVEIGECDTFEIDLFDSYEKFEEAYKIPDFLFPPEAKWKVTEKFLLRIEKPLNKRFCKTKRKLEEIDAARDELKKAARNE